MSDVLRDPTLEQMEAALSAADLLEGFNYYRGEIVCTNNGQRFHPIVARCTGGTTRDARLHAIALALNFTRQRVRRRDLD